MVVAQPPKEARSLPSGGDEARFRKQSEVSGDHGGVKSEHFGERAAALLLLGEEGEDAHPRRMGQGLPQRGQTRFGHVHCTLVHKCKYSRATGPHKSRFARGYTRSA